jgi:hypothetical protein
MSAPEPGRKRVGGGLATAALLAGLALFWATRGGIGVSPDTVQYLDCAANLAAGKGYTTSLHNHYHPLPPASFVRAWKETGAADLPRRPEIQFPPFYPALLAVAMKAGGDGLAAARGLAILLYAINIVLTGGLAWRFTGRRSAAAGAVILMSAAEGMLDVHSSGYSEPLFMALVLAGLAFLAEFLESDSRSALLAGALFMGAAYGAKYTAGMYIVACVLAVVFLAPGRPVRRFGRAVLYAAAASVIPALQIVRNLAVGGDISNRIPGIRNVVGPYLSGAWRTLVSWAAPGAARLPDPVPALAAAAVVAGLLGFGAAVGLSRRWIRVDTAPRPQSRGAALFLFVIPLYVLLFFAAATFLDERLIPDARLYAPLFPAAVISAVVFLDRFDRRLPAGVARTGFRTVLVLYAVLYVLAGAAGLAFIHQNGRGFRGGFWERDDVRAALAYVRSHPDDLIFSNDDAAVRFFTGRYACFTSFGPALTGDAEFAAVLPGAPAVFVYWKRPDLVRSAAGGEAAGVSSGAEAARILGLLPVAAGPRVEVFRAR